MSLRLHRPTPSGLEPTRAQRDDWRERLQARQWRPYRLENPEAAPAGGRGGVLVFGALALGTFVLLVLGYGSGFWH